MLAAGIVHELGQPLQSIASHAAGLEKLLVIETELPATVLEGMSAIRDAAARASAIVRDCRSLAAGSKIERTRADLADVLRATEPLLRAHDLASGIPMNGSWPLGWMSQSA